MAIFGEMGKKKSGKKKLGKLKLPIPAQVRTTPTLQNWFKIAVQRLALSRIARIQGCPPTMETTTAALWLWFSRLDQAKAEGFLVDWFPEVERVLREDAVRMTERGEAPEGSGGSTVDPGSHTIPSEGINASDMKKPRRRKRQE